MNNTIIPWGKIAFTLSLIIFFSTFLPAQEYKAEVSFELSEFNSDSAEEKFHIINELQLFQKQLQKLYSTVDFEASLDGKNQLGLEELRQIMQKATSQFLAENPDVITEPVKHYIESYTLTELKEILAFYQSDLGQKLLETENYLFRELIDARRELEEIKKSIYQEEIGGKKKKKKRK